MAHTEQGHVYRWAFPSEWLADRVGRWSRVELEIAIARLAARIGEDAIQDLWQDAMDRDGYFIPIGPEE